MGFETEVPARTQNQCAAALRNSTLQGVQSAGEHYGLELKTVSTLRGEREVKDFEIERWHPVHGRFGSFLGLVNGTFDGILDFVGLRLVWLRGFPSCGFGLGFRV